MAKTLANSKGTPVEIGRELGVGGEGSVHEVPMLSSQVAKIYNRQHQPDSKKQAKLSYMTAIADEQLLKYVAWPQETLHAFRGGPIVGFLMPKVSGKDPIHMIYSPAYRRQEKPRASWNFLLYVARNTAAAFETLHARGHVLGDVNQGNVLVGADTKVVLIDSDSFQIIGNGARYLCEVAVPHFVPPELQGLSSFRHVVRTANHDNFGLALLIFHLLFGGRHPYSGVPLKSGAGDSLETDIKAFRYAYARDSQMRGAAAPPRSIPITLVPDSMEAMFHQAFTERGAAGGRPTAEQWVTALDNVRAHLSRCNASPMHVYPDRLSKCPWCALEQQGIVYFIDLGTVYARTASGFVLAQVWALIEAVPAPTPIKVPNVANIPVSPTPLPRNIPSKGKITSFRVLLLCLVCGSFFIVRGLWWLSLIACFIGWHVLGSISSKGRETELQNRKAAKEAANSAFDSLVSQLSRESGADAFKSKRNQLVKLRDEHQVLPQNEKQELDKLHKTAFERQRHKFLDGFFIESATIPGVGAGRKAVLRSFGVETAADVDRARVLQVRGFGDALAGAMMDWRASCERRFVFNPQIAVTEGDKSAVRAKFVARKAVIEAALRSAPAELQRLRQAAESRRSVLEPRLADAALLLAQKAKDLAVM